MPEKTKDPKEKRIERLEARITPEQKKLFLRAAELKGRSLTDFVVNTTLEAAYQVIREYEIITLGENDRQVFVEALLNDTEPSYELRQAAERYLKNSNHDKW